MFLFFLILVFNIVKTEIVEVTDKTFDHFVLNTRKTAVVLFYVPSCPHCIKFQPIYREVPNEEMCERNIEFMKINCNAYYEICSRERIRGYPTVKLFKGNVGNRKSIFYNGERNKEELRKFAISNS